MKNDLSSLEQLTLLQEELGYKKGELSTVAMLGLVGETGEVLNETFTPYENAEMFYRCVIGTIDMTRKIENYKKLIRSGNFDAKLHLLDDKKEAFDKELADCFYYLNILATNRGLTINDLAQMAHDKVRAKQAAGGSSEDKQQ